MEDRRSLEIDAVFEHNLSSQTLPDVTFHADFPSDWISAGEVFVKIKNMSKNASSKDVKRNST